MKRKGMIIVLSSPSGAGKSTICKSILAQDKAISLSVSVTTRQPRPNEENGIHYHFINENTYQEMVSKGRLLEYAKVFDHHYGTPKKPVIEALEQGRDILFDIDWQGAQQIHHALPEEVVRIFILPPSRQELENRLLRRAEDSPEIIAQRMAKADQEISHFDEYDYVLINDDLDQTLVQTHKIIQAERLCLKRQVSMIKFGHSLLSRDFERHTK